MRSKLGEGCLEIVRSRIDQRAAQRRSPRLDINTKDNNAFDAKISNVVYTILAINKILLPLNINGVHYREASKWNNLTLEAINEANHV